MPANFRIKYAINNISYLMSVTFTILSTVLTLIDKREIDSINIADIIFESLLILSLTISFIFIYKFNKTLLFVFIGIISLLWLVTGVLGFFTYKNSDNKDFFGICIFLRILRIICVSLFWGNLGFIIDDEDDSSLFHD